MTAARTSLPHSALDQLFRQARTYPRFLDVAIEDEQIQALHELLSWGPTAFNSQPARFLFLKSPAAKARLADCCSSSNKSKVLSAAVSVVVAQDLEFAKNLLRFTAHPQAQALFSQWPELVEPTALRNASLQGAYLILASRSLGLDVGVLTGFDAKAIARTFFEDNASWQANFVVNLGIGDGSSLAARAPRHTFAEVATIL